MLRTLAITPPAKKADAGAQQPEYDTGLYLQSPDGKPDI